MDLNPMTATDTTEKPKGYMTVVYDETAPFYNIGELLAARRENRLPRRSRPVWVEGPKPAA